MYRFIFVMKQDIPGIFIFLNKCISGQLFSLNLTPFCMYLYHQHVIRFCHRMHRNGFKYLKPFCSNGRKSAFANLTDKKPTDRGIHTFIYVCSQFFSNVTRHNTNRTNRGQKTRWLRYENIQPEVIWAVARSKQSKLWTCKVSGS